MVKRRIIIIILLTLLVTIIGVTILIKYRTKLNEPTEVNNVENTLDDEVDDITENTNVNQKKEANVKSTKDKKIEKEGIELKKVNLIWYGKSLDAKGIIINNNKKKKNIDYIELELLDENNKYVDTLAISVKRELKSNEEFEFTTSVYGIKKIDSIKNAKIKKITSSIIGEE